MTDIELIREAADWICPEYRLNCAAEESKSRELRALADRLDAQSKAEPSAWMAEDGRLCSPATKKCAMHKSTAEQFNIPLFTHAAAGEVESLKAGLTDARRTGDYWKMELVAANKEITELESQLSAIRQAVAKVKAGGSTIAFFAALYELDTFNPAQVVNQQLTTDSKPSAQVPGSDSVDRAWNRFNKAISDGDDAPYPGMVTAFEAHYGQSWKDKDWRSETAVWAAAWKLATDKAKVAMLNQSQDKP